MADMAYREGTAARVAAVLVAGTVPSPPAPVTVPCGICRAVLHELVLPEAAVLCSSYLLRKEGITPVPQMRRLLVTELYPHPWEPIVWNEWVGK
jgi:cytidine deaminase